MMIRTIKKEHKKRYPLVLSFLLGFISILLLYFILNSVLSFFIGEKDKNKTEYSTFSENETKWSETKFTDIPSKKSPATEALSSGLYYYYNTLSSEDQRLYDLILDGVCRHEASILLPAKIDDRLRTIFWAMLYDHPEIFWVDAYQYISYSDHTELEPHYLYGKTEIDSHLREIEAVADDFSLLLSENDTEYDIVKKVYLYLIDRVQYVVDSSDNQNLYSSLVNQASVCAGYAKATQYLLQKNEIQTVYVSGRAFNGAWGDHAWNIVRCNGQYYHVDTTFGDGLTDQNGEMERLGICNFAYLCVDDETIYRNHSYSGEFPLPVCNSNDLNYFVQNGTYADVFDERVLESMRDSVCSGEHVWSYQFSNYDAYAACLRHIKEGEYGAIIRDCLSVACQTVYIYDDKMYYVLCWY